jgi:hypothetical protein
MKFKKTIKIFLIDGEPNGRMNCEISNWSGKAYKIPRIKVKDCGDRPDLNNTGIYLLFGKDEEKKDQVYIGEAEIILKRIVQQLNAKDFWNEAIVFISKDENLNKAHIKYLENRLYEIAMGAKRYKIDNSINPTQSSISEADKAEMEEFIEYIKILVNTLGHKVFEEKREEKTLKKEDFFVLKGSREAFGQGVSTSEGFVVFKNSKASLTLVNSMPSGFARIRQKLIDEKILIKREDYFELSEDYIFSSPSTAAAVLLGRSANGLLEWKNSEGKTLKDFETNSKKDLGKH